jgi:hypothetical protein
LNLKAITQTIAHRWGEEKVIVFHLIFKKHEICTEQKSDLLDGWPAFSIRLEV